MGRFVYARKNSVFFKLDVKETFAIEDCMKRQSVECSVQGDFETKQVKNGIDGKVIQSRTVMDSGNSEEIVYSVCDSMRQ